MAKAKKAEHVNASPKELRDHVKLKRGTTSVHQIVRHLSEEKYISNSYWSAWEAGTAPLTDGIRAAVAEAFGWQEDWPENPPAAPVDALDALRAEVASMRSEVQESRALQERTLEAVLRLSDQQSPPAAPPSS